MEADDDSRTEKPALHLKCVSVPPLDKGQGVFLCTLREKFGFVLEGWDRQKPHLHNKFHGLWKGHGAMSTESNPVK